MGSSLKLLLSLGFVVSMESAFGQKKTYLAFEFGPKLEIYQYDDAGNELSTKPSNFSAVGGVSIGQQINKIFIVETGFYGYQYGQGAGLKLLGSRISTSAFRAYQIPVRIRAKFTLFNSGLKLSPTVGYSLVINKASVNEPSNTSTVYHSTEYDDGSTLEFYSTYGLKKPHSLLQTGLSLGWEFKNSIILYLSADYFMGFTKIVDMDVRYSVRSAPERTASAFSNGDYYNLAYGIKFPLSNLWHRRKQTLSPQS